MRARRGPALTAVLLLVSGAAAQEPEPIAPAPTCAPSSTTAPFSTTAPMPIRQLFMTVHA